MAKQKRTIVGENLTPTLLVELGGLEEFPPTPTDFKPDGNWVSTYRIWTCHGYRESGNQNVGALRLERIPDSDKIFTLGVRQEIVQTDDLTNVIEGTIRCRLNQLASPVEWSLSSRFEGPEGMVIPELGSRNHGAATESATDTTGDWCLFEAVQRLAFDKRSSLSFDLLEDMSLSKPGHQLFYRQTYPMKVNGQSMPLHCFAQLGSGILPYEYWLDNRHRLLAVISMNKAYVLDQ
ncbi:MAG: hypothetical protein JSW47_06655 [Phycisphaerales bacterium]|nr:MAG: hypothetical protein JSW47_06655 [Phycisphaerales bacterium]